MKLRSKERRLLKKTRSDGRESFTWKTGTDIGWRVNSCTVLEKVDDKANLTTEEVLNKDVNKYCIPKPCVRSFDKSKLQKFVYQQDGFSATLDKKLGFQYSDKLCIRQVREEIQSMMKKVKRKGRYTQHIAFKNLKSMPQEDIGNESNTTVINLKQMGDNELITRKE